MPKKTTKKPTAAKRATTLEVVSKTPSPAVAVKDELGLIANHVLQLNQAAANHAAQAVYCAAKAGAYLNDAKELLPHGEFGKWCQKSFPALHHATLCRWMGLANQMDLRLKAKFRTVRNLNESPLLSLPDPRDLKDGSNKKLIKQVNDLVDGRGLSELYRDWAIVKDRKSKSKDAKRKLEKAGGGEITKEGTAKVWAERMIDELHAIGRHADHIQEPEWSRLNAAFGCCLVQLGADEEAMTTIGLDTEFPEPAQQD